MHSTLFILLFFVPLCVGIEICPTREIVASSGRITSPGYPNNYPADVDCTLTIKQPLDTKITFTFAKMDIEGEDDDGLSCYDSLEAIGLETKTFCATKLPPPYSSKINIVKLKMISDGSVEQTGFDLSFTSIKTTGLPTPVSVCPTREVTAGQTGRIMSPAFPVNYANNLDCKLTLNIPPNKKTEISFNLFSIQFTNGCSDDTLLITSSGGQSKRACGTGTPAAVMLEGNKVYVHFTTNGADNKIGFILFYRLHDIATPGIATPAIATPAIATSAPSVLGCACPNGNQYIKRGIPQNNMVKRTNDDFALDFKTTEPNGLLLYAKGTVRDYILLKLVNGNIVFEVDLGTGAGKTTVLSGNLHDNAWHSVKVERRGKRVTVMVNNGLSQEVTTTPGSFTKLDIKGNTGALYALGGPTGLLIPQLPNFKGCVRNLVVDGMKPIEALQTNDVSYTLYGSSILAKCSN